MQNVKDIEITEGNVRTIHDKDNRLIWGRLAYDTKYAGDTVQDGTPAPDTPVPVQVVTGEQTVIIHGKNLINSAETHNSINSSGAILNGDQYLGITDYVPCEPNTVYAASFQHDTSDLNLYVGFKDNNGNFIIRNGYGTLRTFTTPENATSMFFYMTKTGATPSIGGYAMLEYGSTVSPFEPYQGHSYPISLGSTELCKIGDYQDYIYNSGDDWYVHKATGKVVLDGTETWTEVGSPLRYCSTPLTGAYLVTNTAQLSPILSDYYISATPVSIYNTTVDYGISLNTTASVRLRNKDVASRSQLITWLTSNNTTVYYALATVTNTKITDATLIGQLNAVHEWLTRYGYSSTVTGNLPIIINKTNL